MDMPRARKAELLADGTLRNHRLRFDPAEPNDRAPESRIIAGSSPASSAPTRGRGSPPFVPSTRRPELYGHVELAIPTTARSSGGAMGANLISPPVRAASRDWERGYNGARLHRALSCLTPVASRESHLERASRANTAA